MAQHTLTIKVESASLLLPLEAGQQPQLDIVGHLEGRRRLFDNAGNRLWHLPWELSIERDSGRRGELMGTAMTSPFLGSPQHVVASYVASHDSFDHLAQLVAMQSFDVFIALRLADLVDDNGTSDLIWPSATVGSEIVMASACSVLRPALRTTRTERARMSVA